MPLFLNTDSWQKSFWYVTFLYSRGKKGLVNWTRTFSNRSTNEAWLHLAEHFISELWCYIFLCKVFYILPLQHFKHSSALLSGILPVLRILIWLVNWKYWLPVWPLLLASLWTLQNTSLLSCWFVKPMTVAPYRLSVQI